MALMHYPPTELVDIMVTQLDGVTFAWMKKELQVAQRQHYPIWSTWKAFIDVIKSPFELEMVVEEACL